MLYNFKLAENGDQYVIDTENFTWALASSIIASPTIAAAEGNLANFVPKEEGKLIPMGAGTYAFEGRLPFTEDGKPSLAVVVIFSNFVFDDNGQAVCVTLIQGNVALKELQHPEIKLFHTECLNPFPMNKKKPAAAPRAPRYIPVVENPPQAQPHPEGVENVQPE